MITWNRARRLTVLVRRSGWRRGWAAASSDRAPCRYRLESRTRVAAAELLECMLHQHELAARIGDLHLVARADAVRWDVQRAAVHLHVTVAHQLPRLPARHGEAHPIDEIVEAALQRHEQRLTGHPGLLQHAIEDVSELPLREPVDAFDLLFLAQLTLIVGRLAPPPGRLPVLTRGVRAPLHRALLGEAARPLEEQLRPLATAQLARRPGVARHALDPPLLGRPAPIVRDRRHVADRADLQARRGERLDRGLAPRAGALHAHVHAPDAQIHRFAGRLLGRHGGGERGRLLGALESGLARGSPGEGVRLHLRDRDERVIERRRDVGHAFGLDHLLGALRARCFRLCHLLFQEGLLLARNRAPRPLLGARVGVRALAAHRQSLAMPRAAVRPDVHQPLDVHRDLGPKRALDLVVPLDHLAQPRDLRGAQVTNARIRIDAGLRENLLRVSQADAVDVREGVQNFLVAWQVDARYACHGVLSLPLLVLGTALADDADDPPPLDHLTMLADRFDAGPNLQTARSGEKSN